MNQFWKRTGWVGMAVLGLLASLALQLALGSACAVVSAFIAGIRGGMQGLGEDALMELVTNATLEGAVWGVLAYHIVSLPVFGLWYYFGCGRKKIVNPLRVIRAKTFVVILVMALGMCLFANGIVLAEEFLLPALFQQYMELMDQAGFGVNPLTVIASILVAPIGEEILCRGIIFHYAGKATEGMSNRRAAFWIANVVQALLFGIMHGNITQGAYAFVLGLALGYLRFRYDSLYASILAHFLVNFLSNFIMGFLVIPENMFGAVILLVLGAVIIAAAAFISGKDRAQD